MTRTKRIPMEIGGLLYEAIVDESNYILISNGIVVRRAKACGAAEAKRLLQPTRMEKLYVEVGK